MKTFEQYFEEFKSSERFTNNHFFGNLDEWVKEPGADKKLLHDIFISDIIFEIVEFSNYLLLINDGKLTDTKKLPYSTKRKLLEDAKKLSEKFIVCTNKFWKLKLKILEDYFK